MDKIYDFINASFLSSILSDVNVTDISFNGSSIYYYHLFNGRQKSEIKVTSEMVNEFLRQLANLGEKLFSIANPYMDLTINNYRLSAIHSSIARFKQLRCPVFSLRILSEECIDLVKNNFMPQHVANLLEVLIKANKSIIISGKTGTGKTELQRYLLELLPQNSKVIVIDNVEELTMSNKSLYDQTFLRVKDYESDHAISDLLKVTLRHNPDWIVIAESRGIEAKQVLKSATTGHPIITTVHSNSAKMTPIRFMQMMEVDEKHYESILASFYQTFPFIVFVDRYEEKGKIRRYLREVLEISYDKKPTFIDVYQNKHGEETLKQLSAQTIEEIITLQIDTRNIALYTGEKNEK